LRSSASTGAPSPGCSAEQAARTQPAVGTVSNGLLALWVRDHAATTRQASKDALQEQWEKATERLAAADPDHFAKGRLKSQPDLFVSQCVHEWAQHGLDVPAALQAAMVDELGASSADLSEPSRAADLAAQYAARFNGRTFVWDAPRRADLFDRDLPTKGPEAGDGWPTVSCTVSTTVSDDSCIVCASTTGSSRACTMSR
jgi:hypothetical protein